MRHYTLKLTAVTPFHIGSGIEYTKKEYYVDESRRKAILINMDKVMQWITAQKRDAYADAFETFMKENRGGDILDFLTRRLNMPEAERKKCEMYSFDCGGAFSCSTKKRTISAFMRDARGCPYVPGSSLKGALRTVLLVKMLRDEPGRAPDLQNLKIAANDAEISLINRLGRISPQKNSLNSIMSGFSVSDSLPFGQEKIIMAPKVDVSTDGAEHVLPLMSECADIGTELYFSLTVSEEAERYAGADYLKKAIEEFSDYYSACYLSKFRVKFSENMDGCIFLGGGSGYFSKNLIYPLAGDRQKALEAVAAEMRKKFDRHRHDRDAGLGVSPHMLKCTRTDGRLRQIGLCRAEITEEKKWM